MRERGDSRVSQTVHKQSVPNEKVREADFLEKLDDTALGDERTFGYFGGRESKLVGDKELDPGALGSFGDVRLHLPSRCSKGIDYDFLSIEEGEEYSTALVTTRSSTEAGPEAVRETIVMVVPGNLRSFLTMSEPRTPVPPTTANLVNGISGVGCVSAEFRMVWSMGDQRRCLVLRR